MTQQGTLKHYRLLTGLSVTRLAGIAQVSRDTWMKAEKGAPIQETNAFKIIQALNERLPADQRIDPERAPIQIYRA